MSKFTTIYDRILTVIPTYTGFTNKTKLPDPEVIEDNNVNFLRNGWGLVVSDGSPSIIDTFNQFHATQIFGVVLTREVKTLESSSTPRETQIKNLKEDEFTLKKEFMKFDQLGIEASIQRVAFANTTPVTRILTAKSNFITITVNFNFEYSEDLDLT